MAKSKQWVLRRDGWTCRYCGEPADTVDHVIPQSYRRISSPDNMVAACFTCNTLLGNLIFESFEAKRQWILKRRSNSTKHSLRADA